VTQRVHRRLHGGCGALDAERVDGGPGYLACGDEGDSGRLLAHCAAFGVEPGEYGRGGVGQRLQCGGDLAFGLRDGLDLMFDAGVPAPTQIRASGGGTASALWRQILADVLDAEIATVDTTEGAAYGAAVLAAVGVGWYPSVEAATEALVSATPVAEPGPDAPRYAAAHAVYRGLYPALAPSFRRM